MQSWDPRSTAASTPLCYCTTPVEHEGGETSHLLPQGGDGAREAQVQRHVQAADVDAQLHRVGGRHAPQLPLQQRPLDLPPLLPPRVNMIRIWGSPSTSSGSSAL